ncbi:DinB/UmuC family translesion DNA polymerase [Streptomyces mirabilis]|uniref:DinB/UmuC family translesion DNA polymerase n=1 Tax=Streptomyces mirabilis TaxID=68239 RepID=UPI00369C1D29
MLALADDLGTRLRATTQIATGVTYTIRNADQTSTRRSRTLPEECPHRVDLAHALGRPASVDVDDVLSIAAQKHGLGLEARRAELIEEADHLVQSTLGARQRVVARDVPLDTRSQDRAHSLEFGELVMPGTLDVATDNSPSQVNPEPEQNPGRPRTRTDRRGPDSRSTPVRTRPARH